MKILFIGFGSIAKKHLWALNEIIKDPEIYAIRSTKNSPEIAGVKSIYQMSEIPNDIHFAIISNPTSAHAGTLLLLSQIGCPVFIEKPLFNEINESNRLLTQQVKMLGIKTYVACNLRFHPMMIAFNNLIKTASGKVEEVNVYCGSYLPNWRPGKNYKEVYSSNRAMGGGVDLDLIHEVDYVTWFFGFPNRTIALKSSASNIDIQAPDAAYYLLQYDKFVVNIGLNYFRRQSKRTFEVVMSDQTFMLDLVGNKIYREGEVVINGSEQDLMTSYLEQMKYFIGCIDTGLRVENDIENAYKVLEICLADEIEK